MILPRLARLLLRLGGWTAVGKVPDIRKAVLIAAPHTSNWDGFWALVYIQYIGLEVHWFVKDSMFWFPMSSLLRAFGAIPLDRKRARLAVQEAIAAFDSGDDRFYFGLAPEGTRSSTPGWKSGFYRIAEGASVPVVFGFLDYGKKRLGLGPALTLTGDKQADMVICRSFYESIEGRRPDKKSPIELST
ncbi:MAG: 1-acyl-sn-glycerol-3-phosphate acyltransferase [Gammaproteobacteria bacterium]|nr:1-acyl-sn-glycerol-3-phosphate acyltransferase [Gammaproteobacteria bacterium]MDH3372376.1 1-acyl-sn-glycerol-3-phosphate acyltransferase [Gammaproteobacteria bacterium]MDH3408667.1 1-acyl-sn-glycerol-3-phosphate acyltransferase [Gammaproteobacteria bacterium]MDH3551550.1 1-acyl-sn-glycerol-3-phosphate acyltransferase [Gammaproteobacteria bacterium]